MITINVRAIAFYALLSMVVWYGWPIWVQLARLLIDVPIVRAGLVGFFLGIVLKASWAWNMALRYRRDQAIEKAEREYAQDRKKVV